MSVHLPFVTWLFPIFDCAIVVKALLLQDLADGRGRQSLRISDDDDAVLLGGPSAPGGGQRPGYASLYDA